MEADDATDTETVGADNGVLFAALVGCGLGELSEAELAPGF